MTKKYSLKELTTNNDFVKRHIGPRPHQQIEMLKAIGFNSFEEMAKTIVPKDIQENLGATKQIMNYLKLEL